MASMPDDRTAPLTLMAVLAHPDDESTSACGVLARYAVAGVRTVVVTCTDGEMGDGPNGVKPGQPGREPRHVAATRRAELAAACAHLAVASTERLGYRDSGAATANHRLELPAFCAVPVADAAARLAGWPFCCAATTHMWSSRTIPRPAASIPTTSARDW
jgi:LmbE family N-acetylglucosaminyl deacetylase